MSERPSRYRRLVWLLPLLLAACANPREPFVIGERGGPFGRSWEDMGRQSEAPRTEVEVCYNAKWTTPAEVTGLAREACAEDGLYPRFRKQDYLACPLFLPARVTYDCVAPPPGVTVRRPAPPPAPAEGPDLAAPEGPEPGEPPPPPAVLHDELWDPIPQRRGQPEPHDPPYR